MLASDRQTWGENSTPLSNLLSIVSLDKYYPSPRINFDETGTEEQAGDRENSPTVTATNVTPPNLSINVEKPRCIYGNDSCKGEPKYRYNPGIAVEIGRQRQIYRVDAGESPRSSTIGDSSDPTEVLP